MGIPIYSITLQMLIVTPSPPPKCVCMCVKDIASCFPFGRAYIPKALT